jgi:transposase-like protein
VNSLTLQLSSVWHADELFIKMHGGMTYNGRTNSAFLWNVMDRKTRLLIASKVSEARDINRAIAVFKQAITNAHGSEPEQVLTLGFDLGNCFLSEKLDYVHVSFPTVTEYNAEAIKSIPSLLGMDFLQRYIIKCDNNYMYLDR